MSDIEVDFVSDFIITEMESVLEELDGMSDGKITDSTELCRHLYCLSEDTQLDCSLCESLSVQKAVAEARRTWKRNKPLECIMDGKSLPNVYHGSVNLRRVIQPSISKIALNAVVNFRSEAHKCVNSAENPNGQIKEAGSMTDKIQNETFRQVASYIDFLFDLETDRSKKASKGLIKFAQTGSQTDLMDQLIIQELCDDNDDATTDHKKHKKEKKKKKKKHKKKDKKSKGEEKYDNIKAPLPAMIVYPGMDRMVNEEDRAALLRAGAISEDIRTIKVVKKNEDKSSDMARKECESAYDEFAKELELMAEKGKSGIASTKKHLFPAADQYLPSSSGLPIQIKLPSQINPPKSVDVSETVEKKPVIPDPVQPEDDGTLDSILFCQLEYFAQQLEALLLKNNSNENANRKPLKKSDVKIKESSRMNELLATTIQTLCGKKKLKGTVLHHVAAIDDVDTSMKRQWTEIVKDMDQIYDDCTPPPKPKKIKLSINGFLPPDFNFPTITLSKPPKRIRTFESCERNVYRLLDLALVNKDIFLREVKLNVKDFESTCVEPGMSLPWALTLAIDPRTHSVSLSPPKESESQSEVGGEKKIEKDDEALTENKETSNIPKIPKKGSRNSLAAAFRQAIEAKKRIASKEQQNQKRKLPTHGDIQPAKRAKNPMFFPSSQPVFKDNTKTNLTANESLTELLENLDKTLIDDIGTNLMKKERQETLLMPKIYGFSSYAANLFKQLPKSKRNDPFATKFRKANFKEINVFKPIEQDQSSKLNEQYSFDKEQPSNDLEGEAEMEIDSDVEQETTQERTLETSEDCERPSFEPFRFDRVSESNTELPKFDTSLLNDEDAQSMEYFEELRKKDQNKKSFENLVATTRRSPFLSEISVEASAKSGHVIPLPDETPDPQTPSASTEETGLPLPSEILLPDIENVIERDAPPLPPDPLPAYSPQNSPPLPPPQIPQSLPPKVSSDSSNKEITKEDDPSNTVESTSKQFDVNEDSSDIPLPPDPEDILDDVPLPRSPLNTPSDDKKDAVEDPLDAWKKQCQKLIDHKMIPPPVLVPGQVPLVPPPLFPSFPPDKTRPPLLLLPPPPIIESTTITTSKKPKVTVKTGKFQNLKVYVWRIESEDQDVIEFLLENGGEEIDPYQVLYLKSAGIKKDILIFVNKKNLSRVHLLPNVSLLRKVMNIHFLAFSSLEDVKTEQCTEVMMKGGLLLPDDKALLQTHPTTLEMLAEFMVQQKEKKNNWQLVIHQFNLDTIELIRDGMKGSDSKIKRLRKVENILNHYKSLGVVKVLERHSCDAHPKPASELLECAIKMQTSPEFYENYRHIIVVTDTDSNSPNMCMFGERGVGVMSMEKFVIGVVGKKPENPSRIVDPAFGLRVERYFIDAQPSNAIVKLKWNHNSVGK